MYQTMYCVLRVQNEKLDMLFAPTVYICLKIVVDIHKNYLLN